MPLARGDLSQLITSLVRSPERELGSDAVDSNHLANIKGLSYLAGRPLYDTEFESELRLTSR